MSINIIVYLLLLLGAYYFSNSQEVKPQRDFIIFCSLIVVLKTSLRSVTIGVDTSHYSGYFYESMQRSWRETIQLLYNSANINEIEGGYKLIEKIFSTFLSNFNLYTFFVQSLLYYTPIGIMMYRECTSIREILFGYVLLNALFMGLPMANARQVYALGFCVWSYLFIADKRIFPSLICVLFAYSIHHSALLFLPFIMLCYVPFGIIKKFTIASFVALPAILLSVNRVILQMGRFIGSDKYAGYGSAEDVVGKGVTYISLSLCLCIFVYIALNRCYEDKYKRKLYYILTALTTLFIPLIYSNGSMIRITMYFQLFFIMLVPKMIEVYFPAQKKIIYTILIFVLIVLSIISEESYVFFWEENQNPYLHWS